jgi:hypothetical protein
MRAHPAERSKATQPDATRVADPILALVAERDRLARSYAEAEVRGEDDEVLDALAMQTANVELAICDTPATTIAGAIARLGIGVALMRPSPEFIRGPEERATVGAFEDLQRLLPKPLLSPSAVGGAPIEMSRSPRR